MAAVDLPSHAANRPHSVGAERAPKMSTSNSKNTPPKEAQANLRSSGRKGIWWNASETSAPKSRRPEGPETRDNST
eukprot:734543-Lingulodinium_polyedra.AAC.1